MFMALRKPLSRMEKAIAETFEIKRPLVVPDPDGLHIISGNCFYCEAEWVHELEVDTIDSETGELTGTVEIRVCEACRGTKLTKISEDRIRLIRTRERNG